MANCPGCGTQLGCQCQLKMAPDGRKLCASCVGKMKSGLQVPNKVFNRLNNRPVVSTTPFVNSALLKR